MNIKSFSIQTKYLIIYSIIWIGMASAELDLESRTPPFVSQVSCGTEPEFINDQDKRCLGDWKLLQPLFYWLGSGVPNITLPTHISLIEKAYRNTCPPQWRTIKACALRFLAKTEASCNEKLSGKGGNFVTFSWKLQLALQDGFCADYKGQSFAKFLKAGGFQCITPEGRGLKRGENILNKFGECVQPFGIEGYAQFKRWFPIEGMKCLRYSLSNCNDESLNAIQTTFKIVNKAIQKIN